jgi:outer membrane protein OmpA-like peptidoglycan-associated protein
MHHLKVVNPCDEPWSALTESSDGSRRRCERCSTDVHDLLHASPEAALTRVLFRRELSICARIATVAAVSVAALSCSAPREVATPTTEEPPPPHETATPPVVAPPAVDAGSAGDASVDTDGDGIADVDDACPTVPGDQNNNLAKNGCPAKIIVQSMGIVVIPQLYFERAHANLPAGDHAVLESVIEIMKSRPEIKHVEVEGHASDDEPRPQALSEARARATMDAMVHAGIDPARLSVKGFGASAPVDPGHTPEARAKNRRVTFRVTDHGDGT